MVTCLTAEVGSGIMTFILVAGEVGGSITTFSLRHPVVICWLLLLWWLVLVCDPLFLLLLCSRVGFDMLHDTAIAGE